MACHVMYDVTKCLPFRDVRIPSIHGVEELAPLSCLQFRASLLQFEAQIPSQRCRIEVLPKKIF